MPTTVKPLRTRAHTRSTFAMDPHGSRRVHVPKYKVSNQSHLLLGVKLDAGTLDASGCFRLRAHASWNSDLQVQVSASRTNIGVALQ